MADVQVKRKIGIGVSPHARISHGPQPPSSPTKSMLAVASASNPPKPRAKVTSSAHVAFNKKSPSVLSTGHTSGSSTPRAPSPIRRQQSHQSSTSQPPKLNFRTLSRVRSKANLSAASAPCSPRFGIAKAEYGSLSTTTSDPVLAKPSPPRVRQPSISSVSQISAASSPGMSGVGSPALSAVSYSQDSDAQSNVSTQRIKAKVTSLAKGKPPNQMQPFPSPLLMPSPALGPSISNPLAPTAQARQRITRTVSIGSLSAPKSPPIYPITTAHPGANVHRFATVRTPSASHRPPHMFTSPLQTDHKPTNADPALVPLPPLSPSVSNASYSSRSSTSRSSVSAANSVVALTQDDCFTDDHVNGLHSRIKLRSTSIVIHNVDDNHSPHGGSSELEADGTGEEQTIKAEAKSHRKIADLEITTKSLLAINAQLEANKHKQAKEIRDLRRKLRESQLALPPRAYRELKAIDDVEELDKDDDEIEEQTEEGDEDARMTTQAMKLGKDDEAFDRVRLIVASLLATGRQALAVNVEDLAPPKGAAKVLHEEEARTWRDGVIEDRSGMSTSVRDSKTIHTSDGLETVTDFGEEEDAFWGGTGNDSRNTDDSTKSEREVEELIGNLKSSLSANLQS